MRVKLLAIACVVLTVAAFFFVAGKQANVVRSTPDSPSEAILKIEPIYTTKRSGFYRITDYDNNLVCYAIESTESHNGGRAIACVKVPR